MRGSTGTSRVVARGAVDGLPTTPGPGGRITSINRSLRQHLGKDLPAGAPAGLGEGVEEKLAIAILKHKGLAPAKRCGGESLQMEEVHSTTHRPRESACAAAALRAEMERVGNMTIEERVKAALTMRQRFTWLAPAKKATGP
ncbi:MAG TPA: hypothetical protein VMN36_09200 [Verrucomicrobiales bacterium]|nr:hypothetical protein [Verrucomicrobiales bacterium]